MKNILVIGPPRSGKTTLSKMISKEIACYNIINIDVIRDGIYEAFFKNTDKNERNNAVKKAFPDFINKMLKQYQEYYNPELYYVIEGDILSIEDALKMYYQYEIEIVCIGTPKIEKQVLFERIRTNASKYGCWTEKYTDDELLKECEKIIERSKTEESISKENNLTYLDTSINMDCLLEYVKKLKCK